jgi:hypothetical protein
MKNFRGRSLSRDQFNLLSWLGTYIYNHANKTMDQYATGKLQGISSSCTFAGIDDLLIYDVEINQNLTGLQNHNRLTEIVYFK